MNKPTKLQWANSLRAIATLAVIILHVCSAVEINFGKVPLKDWLIANIYDSAVRWCVPIFVMLTGSFALNNYKGDLKLFLIKTFQRIIVPFLFWSLVYFLYYHINNLSFYEMTQHQKINLLVEKILSGTAVHLWFVYMLISLYFLIPILSSWIQRNNLNEQLFFIVLWVLFLFVQPWLDGYETSFDYNYYSGFIGYLILGNYLYKQPGQVNSGLLIALFIVALGYTCFMNYTLTITANTVDQRFMDNFKPNVAVMCACVYLLFKNNQVSFPNFLRTWIDKICAHSYGIFLIHLLVLDIFFKYGFTYYRLPVIFSIPLISICCLLVSFTIIHLLKKIPYLRALAG